MLLKKDSKQLSYIKKTVLYRAEEKNTGKLSYNYSAAYLEA